MQAPTLFVIAADLTEMQVNANIDEADVTTPAQALTALSRVEKLSFKPGSQFKYSNSNFFPIDGQLLGNSGRSHNFHFTLESSFDFHYIGGDVFRFKGDGSNERGLAIMRVGQGGAQVAAAAPRSFGA